MAKNYTKIPPRNDSRQRRNQHSSKSGYFVILLLLIIGITGYYVFSRGVFVSNRHGELPNTLTNETGSVDSRANTAPVKPRFEFYTVLSHETVPVPHENNQTANAVTADATTTETPSTKTTPKETPVTENKDKSSAATQVTSPSSETGIAPTGVSAIKIPVATPHAPSLPPKKTAPLPPVPTTTITPSSSNRYVLQVAVLQNSNAIDQLKAKLSFLGFNANIEPFHNNGTTWYRIKVGPFSSQEAVQKARQTLASNHLSGILITLPPTKI